MINKTETEAKEIANKICETITIRSYNEYGSVDTERPTTDEEKDIMFKIVYGALFTFYWDNVTEAKGQAVAYAMEIVFTQFFPNANGYLSIYRPLKEVFKLWEEN